MHALRQFLLAHRSLAALAFALTLALRLLVPGGYMIAAGEHGPIVTLCPGTIAVPAVPAAAMVGMAHGTPADDPSGEHGGMEMPCAFAGLSAPLLGGVDVVLLAAALAFVALRALRAPVRCTIRPVAYLRPPPRGPPAPR